MRFLVFTLAFMLTMVYSSRAWAQGQKITQRFSNITIETSGDQTYDLETNIVTVPDHAKITLDDVVIEADSLIYYGNQNLTVATGNVFLTKPGLTMTAKRLTYQDTTGLVEASGSARLVSPQQSYTSESIRYNLTTMTGEVGAFRGVVESGKKNYYLTGEQAKVDAAVTTITPAGLTRCPRLRHPDYIFNSKKMRIVEDQIYLEKVVIKVLGVPVLYLPRLKLSQNNEAPDFSMNSNQGDEPDLSTPGGSFNPSPELRSRWVYRIEANTTRPAKIALGRAYAWGRYSDRFEAELNSNGFFSLVDTYGIDFKKYHLAFDGKIDLTSEPERELGVTFSRKTWDTGYGDLKLSVFSRLLYTKESDRSYQGVYSGIRFDYQPHKLLSFSYFYLDPMKGSEADWDQIEPDFMEIKNYRLGGNFMFNSDIPLSAHYSILYKGSYNFDNSGWTSHVLGLTREVCCLRCGFGWDFAKELLELRFKLSF